MKQFAVAVTGLSLVALLSGCGSEKASATDEPATTILPITVQPVASTAEFCDDIAKFESDMYEKFGTSSELRTGEEGRLYKRTADDHLVTLSKSAPAKIKSDVETLRDLYTGLSAEAPASSEQAAEFMGPFAAVDEFASDNCETTLPAL